MCHCIAAAIKQKPEIAERIESLELTNNNIDEVLIFPPPLPHYHTNQFIWHLFSASIMEQVPMDLCCICPNLTDLDLSENNIIDVSRVNDQG